MKRLAFVMGLYLSWIVSSEPSNGFNIASRKCPSNIVINAKNFFEVYLQKNASGTFGLFPQILNNVSKACCGEQKVEIMYLNETSRLSIQNLLYHARERLGEDQENNNTLVFYFPTHSSHDESSYVFKEFYYVQIMKSPGPAFIMLTEELQKAPDPTKILIECWPIFLLLIIMAWVVGVIGWFLDHWKNSEQFPNNFYKGSWEGFWWAMVTMTTVGYGDKAPLSFFARLLTVLWMITGAIVTSLFTANVTTVLTTKNVAALQNVLGQKVGVLNSKHYFLRTINEGARFVEYQDQDSLVQAFYTKNVTRVLVPNYLDYLYFAAQQSSPGDSVISKVIDHPFSVGLGLVNNVKKNEGLKDFLKCWETSIVTSYEENELDYSTIDPSVYRTAEDAKSLINQTSILNIVYGLVALLLVFFGLGSLWECWKHRSGLIKKMDIMSNSEIEMSRFTKTSL